MSARAFLRDSGGVPRKWKRFFVRDASGTPRLIQRAFERDSGGIPRLVYQAFTQELLVFTPSSPGTGTVIVPEGANNVLIEGGSAGAQGGNSRTEVGGGGAGSGALVRSSYPCVAGQTLTYQLGTGGRNGGTGGEGEPGGATVISSGTMSIQTMTAGVAEPGDQTSPGTGAIASGGNQLNQNGNAGTAGSLAQNGVGGAGINGEFGTTGKGGDGTTGGLDAGDPGNDGFAAFLFTA